MVVVEINAYFWCLYRAIKRLHNVKLWMNETGSSQRHGRFPRGQLAGSAYMRRRPQTALHATTPLPWGLENGQGKLKMMLRNPWKYSVFTILPMGVGVGVGGER